VRRIQRHKLVVVPVALLMAGCGSTAPTSAPTTLPTVQPSPTAAVPAVPTPSPIATASAATVDPFLGAIVVTVSDRLRVRSAPEVSDASIKYEPLLPLGTRFRVIGGPVNASGYVWYDVTPMSLALSGGIEHGWVAAADHDGEPWLALADQPIAGLETATSSVRRAAADPAAARAVARSVTAFGLDMYRQVLADPTLKLQTSNLVFSPTSIALALGLARAGARGETAGTESRRPRHAGCLRPGTGGLQRHPYS
jgi:hypothetical protein